MECPGGHPVLCGTPDRSFHFFNFTLFNLGKHIEGKKKTLLYNAVDGGSGVKVRNSSDSVGQHVGFRLAVACFFFVVLLSDILIK